MTRSLSHALVTVALVTAATTACGTALLETDPPALGEAFELGPGESAEIDGTQLALRFQEVPQDSRCPADVTCVWEGDAVIVLEATLDGAEEAVSLHTAGDRERDGARYVDVGPYRIHLVELLPVPLSEHTIPVSSYRVTLRVTAGA